LWLSDPQSQQHITAFSEFQQSGSDGFDSPAFPHDASADAATRARSAVSDTRAERSWSVVTRPTARGHQLHSVAAASGSARDVGASASATPAGAAVMPQATDTAALPLTARTRPHDDSPAYTPRPRYGLRAPTISKAQW